MRVLLAPLLTGLLSVLAGEATPWQSAHLPAVASAPAAPPAPGPRPHAQMLSSPDPSHNIPLSDCTQLPVPQRLTPRYGPKAYAPPNKLVCGIRGLPMCKDTFWGVIRSKRGHEHGALMSGVRALKESGQGSLPLPWTVLKLAPFCHRVSPCTSPDFRRNTFGFSVKRGNGCGLRLILQRASNHSSSTRFYGKSSRGEALFFKCASNWLERITFSSLDL